MRSLSALQPKSKLRCKARLGSSKLEAAYSGMLLRGGMLRALRGLMLLVALFSRAGRNVFNATPRAKFPRWGGILFTVSAILTYGVA